MTAASKVKPRSGSTGRKKKPRTEKGGPGLWLRTLFTGTYFGRVFLVLLAAVAVAGVTLLVSGNRYERFFLLIGITAMLAAGIGWLVYLLKQD